MRLLWARLWRMAKLDSATSGRYAASAPEFLMPSTIGPTSDVPNSTVVFVYTGLGWRQRLHQPEPGLLVVAPALARIGDTTWKTSLFAKDGGFVVPVKAPVRAAAEPPRVTWATDLVFDVREPKLAVSLRLDADVLRFLRRLADCIPSAFKAFRLKFKVRISHGCPQRIDLQRRFAHRF